MANEGVTTTWPFEGHFVVGGSGLYVSNSCLGRTFTSRTASYDLTIGFPQADNRPDPFPPEIRQRLGEPPSMPKWDLIPPAWAYGPRNDDERFDEEHISPVWGGILDDGRAEKVFPESSRDRAVVVRCRFYTTLAAADGDEFEAAAKAFLGELDDWWKRFTSWVGILTVQDFVGLGGYPGGATRSRPLLTWTGDTTGQRANVNYRSYFPPARLGFAASTLQWNLLEACVAATGKQDPPPAEWLFIRDARALVNAGQIRRAVLDAGTAAELAMTTLVDRHLEQTDAEEAVRKALTRSYNTLGGRRELLDLLRPGLLPDGVQKDLIELRNTASHGRSKAGRRWDEITDEQGAKAVEIATTIVDLAHPLSNLLPSSP